jgi:hypothetical protein
MGFNVVCTRLLFKAKKLGVNFDKTLTLGRQNLHIREWEMKKHLNKAGYDGNISKSFYNNNNIYAEPFLKWLGATAADSMDANSYEGSTVIHDLNFPIPETLKGKYSVVIDGGSLEHVFNFPVAIKNCMDMIQPGGYFIAFSPANNHFGHGFYQFSPELFYRVFSAKNGFRMMKMYMCFEKRNSSIYEVADPQDVKERVNMTNKLGTYLFVIAQKTEQVEPFRKVPLQSDYELDTWLHPMTEKRAELRDTFIRRIKKMIPLRYKLAVLKMLRSRPGRRWKLYLSDTGLSDKKFFKKVE